MALYAQRFLSRVSNIIFTSIAQGCLVVSWHLHVRAQPQLYIVVRRLQNYHMFYI